MTTFRIRSAEVDFLREPLSAPFGFKGRYLTELWQALCRISTADDEAVFPATLSPLWSDGKVFTANSPAGANALMFAVTQKAACLLEGMEISRPDTTLDEILPALCAYADALAGCQVRRTFVLNALVGIDMALWTLWARANGASNFDKLIPAELQSSFSAKHDKLAHIPLISYGVGENDLRAILEQGNALLKIKIGASVDRSDPETDMKTMLAQDKKRLEQIHTIARDYTTPLSHSGHICYYLDANGRYDTRARLESLLEYADKIGALSSICLLEEPFDEHNEVDVTGLPVVVNADESAHSPEDVRRKLACGYRAVALKPIAKTLSVSFRMADAAVRAGGQCLCADLTVNPLLSEWNKQFACRIPALSALNCGCVEVNGDQNYSSWEAQKLLLPDGYAYTDAKGGAFPTGKPFRDRSGKLFGVNGYARTFLRTK